MRATGLGKKLYLKYQFTKRGCSDLKTMQEYLKESTETSDELISMLKSTPNISVDTFEVVLNEAFKRTNSK
jgi:hypothetical protein